jgi:hypothetical protein
MIQMMHNTIQNKGARYIAWALPIVFVVDFGTAGGFNPSYFTRHGPHFALGLLIVYLIYALSFSYLIFNRKWDNKRLLVAICIAIALNEGILVRNPFVVTFPLLLFGIPLAICIYTFETFCPLWIVQNEMKKHKRTIMLLATIVTATMIVSVVLNW